MSKTAKLLSPSKWMDENVKELYPGFLPGLMKAYAEYYANHRLEAIVEEARELSKDKDETSLYGGGYCEAASDIIEKIEHHKE